MAESATRRKTPKTAEVPEELQEVFAERGEDYEYEVAGKIPLGGKEFRVLAGSNAYLETGIASGDPDSFMRHIRKMIHPDDWESFEDMLSNVPDLPAEKLMALWKLVWDVAAERPTQ